MRRFLLIPFLLICVQFTAQTTLTVKKQKQIDGLYYAQTKSNKHKYLRFNGDSVSVWISPIKLTKKSNVSYGDFARTRYYTTNYTITDSLLTFTFKQVTKSGKYIFEDYHCILSNMKKLTIKKGSTYKTVVIETYQRLEPKKKRRRKRKSLG